MDPTACLRRVGAALRADDWEEASLGRTDLKEWIGNGGFLPDWAADPMAAAYVRGGTCIDRDGACSQLCPGWVWSLSDEYGWNLERCDDCARFDSDNHAHRHVTSCAPCSLQLAVNVVNTSC